METLFESLPLDVIREEYDHIASLCNMICEANRDPESVERLAAHHILEGMEFAVMRAAWILGEHPEAHRLHARIGPHASTNCPVCVGDKAFGTGPIAA